MRFVVPEGLVTWAFELLEVDGVPLFLRCPVAYVLDDEVPAFDKPLRLARGLVIADLTADPERACEAIHRMFPRTEYVPVESASRGPFHS